MYKQGIEVKRETDFGIVIEKSSWFSIIEKICPNSKRVYYPNDQDEVLHVEVEGIDIAFIAGQGSSMAACMTERLRVYGAKAIVRIGTCGALSKSVTLWDPIITTGCFSDEGTSRHYLPIGFPIMSDLQLSNKLSNIFESNLINYISGITVTTDGRWKEDPELLKTLNKIGVISIEMETAAILAVSQFRKVPAAAVNIPTDLPTDEDDGNDFKGVPDRLRYNDNLKRTLNIVVPLILQALISYDDDLKTKNHK